MNKKIKKILYVLLTMAMVFVLFSCKKKAKHKWIEVGSDPNPSKVEPGIHPERGSASDIPQIETAIIYVPVGMQEKVVIEPSQNKDSDNGNKQSSSKNSSSKNKKTAIKRDYKTVLYEMEELTSDNIDKALKALNVISEDMVLYSFEVLPDDNAVVSAGPMDKNQALTQKGIVRYVDFISSPLDNSDNYENKLNEKDLIGKIDGVDIINCITETFASNFNLSSCEVILVDNNGNDKKD